MKSEIFQKGAPFHMGFELAIKYKIECLKDEDPEVRIEAIKSLGNYHSVLAVLALISVLDDEYPEVRRLAVKELSMIDDPRSLQPTITLLNDHDPEVRSQATSFLPPFRSFSAYCQHLTPNLCFSPSPSGSADMILLVSQRNFA